MTSPEAPPRQQSPCPRPFTRVILLPVTERMASTIKMLPLGSGLADDIFISAVKDDEDTFRRRQIIRCLTIKKEQKIGFVAVIVSPV